MKKITLVYVIVLIVVFTSFFYFEVDRETKLIIIIMTILLGLCVVILNYFPPLYEQLFPKKECVFIEVPKEFCTIVTLEKRYKIYGEHDDKVVLYLDDDSIRSIKKKYIKII